MGAEGAASGVVLSRAVSDDDTVGCGSLDEVGTAGIRRSDLPPANFNEIANEPLGREKRRGTAGWRRRFHRLRTAAKGERDHQPQPAAALESTTDVAGYRGWQLELLGRHEVRIPPSPAAALD